MQFIILFLVVFNISVADIEKYRMLYRQSISSEKSAQVLVKETDNTANNALIKGYRAAGMALLAKHKTSPWDKLTYLKKSETLFKEAVNEDPANIEIRFLRLTVEYNTPSVLGMSSHVAEDTKLINANLKQFTETKSNTEMANTIVSFLKKNNLYTQPLTSKNTF